MQENRAEVSGKFRYEADAVSDFSAVGDYLRAKKEKYKAIAKMNRRNK